MEPYCDSCFMLLKLFDSCPRVSVFQQAELLPKVLEVIWVSASLVPFIVYGALAVYALFSRTSRALLFILCLLVQQLINDEILKKILAEHRPSGACSSSFGLPSGHSSFTASWSILMLYEWFLFHNKVPFKAGRFHVPLRTLGIAITPLIPVSRFFLNYHTPKQIFCGLATGLVLTTLTFYAFMALIHKDHGKMWGSTITAHFKRFKIEDNIVLYGSQLDDMMLSQMDLEQQAGQDEVSVTTEGKELHMILPLKKEIRYYFWKKIEIKIENSSS